MPVTQPMAERAGLGRMTNRNGILIEALAEIALAKTEQRRANLQGAYLYKANLQGAYLYKANLQGAYLYKANLQDATLQGANLQGANLQDANLQDATLQDATLQGATLQDATLTGATLTGANLYKANLQGATLTGANLYKANLQGATLYKANLQDANLTGSTLAGAYLQDAFVQGTKWPSPTMVLLATWGQCSDALTVQLMRYDAFCHGEPALFEKWAAGGPCPYGGVDYQRACDFLENRTLYSAGPSLNVHTLMQMLLAEKCKLK